MNCIDEQLLQQYIDNECIDSEIAGVNQHLSACPVCAKRLAEREQLSKGIKRALDTLTVEEFKIPAFSNKNTRLPNRNVKLLLYSLSAACILLFVLLVVDKEIRPIQNEITILQSIPVEVDANRPAGDQELVIEVYNGTGQCSEFYIE